VGPQLSLHWPPLGLIFVGLCDSQEVSTHPSNTEREEGNLVILCQQQKKEERKTAKKEFTAASVTPSVSESRNNTRNYAF